MMKKAAKPKSPNVLTYNVVKAMLRLLSTFLVSVKFQKDPEINKIKGPVLALGTHSTPMDVAFSFLAVRKKRLNVVCGRDVLSWKWLNVFRKGLRMIPTSQFDLDLSSVKAIKRAVASGCSIALFPEGKISIDGRNLHYIAPAITKLIKLLNVPVVFSHAYGGFSVKPRWGHGIRRGRIVYKSEVLFSQDQIKEMSSEDMHKVLVEKFKYNDNEYRIENKLQYKCINPAEGMHYILYKCPKCGTEYEMDSKGDEVFCKVCGYKVMYGKFGQFEAVDDNIPPVFDRIDTWYDYQKKSVVKEISEDTFEISKPVSWYSMDNVTFEYEKMGEGMLYINKEVIGFTGKDLIENPVEFQLSLSGLFTVVQKVDEAIDLTVNTVIHRFIFKEGKYSAKYNLIVEEMFKLNNKVE
jgi:1-acyl-sn-glycerol-3-phosphate acyltransferase/DNA-directed RNA polymerase subunit RPC12/RpoP